MKPHLRQHGVGYLVAIAATAAVVLLRWLLDPWMGYYLPFITLYGAVAAAVWYGGYRPALVAAALGYLACNYLFMEPRGSIALLHSHHYIGLVLYVFTCSLIVGFGEAMRAARRRAEREVTERKQAEDELRRAEEQARSVVASVLDGIITIDERGMVQALNPAAERLFGYPASEVIGQNVKLLMPEPYQHEHDKYLSNYLRTGEAKIIGVGREVVGRRKDGSTFPMELAVSEFSMGGRRHFTGIVRDITERKRNEAEVRRLNRELQSRVDELQSVLKVLPVGMAIAHDPACRRMTLNPYMSGLLGVPVDANASLSAPPEERPTTYTNYRDGKEVPPDQLPMQVACTGVEIRDFEVDLVRMGRDPVRLLCYARPLVDRDGQVRGSVGAFLDITELNKVQQALIEADQRKDEFLATLAHELRNPLAPLRNAVELLRRAGGDAALLEKARSMMERQVGQMVRLVDDLLDISRITRGKIQLRKERVELAAVVRSAVEAARPLIEAQAHELTVTLPPQPLYLDADPTRLAQVFSNLLTNAAKYTEKGGHVWLTAERQGGEAVVSVRDTGMGIAADYLPHVFEMFSQAAPALERSQGGLGVGLALVRGLVELHGGTIEARSGGPGLGSEFIVRLPVAQRPAQVAQEPSGDGQKCRSVPKCRILVVDDNRDTADSLAIMLRLAGHDIHTAYDGLEGLQAAATFRPDVVLLDIGLPRMNGYEAARHIREQPWGKGMALIALTGWGQDEDKRRALEAGFDHHLTKPVDALTLEKLLALITSVPQR
jgi:PAS domain S-box-containing protein